MTALEAIQQAQQTGQIAITKETANMLEAVENFIDSAEDLNDAFGKFLPDDMADNKATDKFFMDFYTLFDPLQDFVFDTVGGVMLKKALVYGLKGRFEGV